ncbi:MAG TPA: hypothetical protein VF541_09465 [Longimicrobium sp.]|jgi:hypothetical protein
MFLREVAKTLAAAAALAAMVVAAGCDLTEVATEEGQDVVVVEAVLRTDFARQQVLLHRAVQGRLAGPVSGATVTVQGTDGVAHRLVENTGCFRIDPAYAQSDSLEFQGTCYISPGSDAGWMRAGGTYDLTVRTQDGRVIRGRTHVPGDFAVPSVPTSASIDGVPFCSLAPDSAFTLLWTRARDAASYVADLRITGLRAQLGGNGYEVPDPLELRGLSVSESDTTVLLPTEFGVFERLLYDSDLLKAIAGGFPENTNVDVVLAAADLNWVNSVRGGNFNPSGLIRISTVVGDGVGVFGSMVVKRAGIVVRRRLVAPRCGVR